MDAIYVKNYIDGRWVDSMSGEKDEVINPADGTVLGHFAKSGREDTALAIATAKRAFYEDKDSWRRMDGQKRADILLKIANKLEDRADEVARLESMNNGKPLREALGDVDDAVHCFRYYAGLITKPQGGVYHANDNFGKMRSFTTHEPIGVCGLITPWNYPLLMGVWKLAPALAAGNSIVYKPSSNTPMSSKILFEIFDSVGLPKGTVNMVVGPGGAVGNELSESLDVDMISFTGSTGVGKGIATKAAINMKKVGLELGGKSPNIIFSDADFEGAIEWAMVDVF